MANSGLLLSDIYFFYFALTFLVEGIIIALTYKLEFSKISKSFFINLITHPWAYYFSYFQSVDFLVVEIVVFLVEIALFRSLITKNWKKALLLSFLCNFTSGLVGRLIDIKTSLF